MTLFNRSHYEDVLAARVHKLVPEPIWKGRYAHINAFERLVLDADVILLKFYLHVSADEQYERLRAREKDPRTAWKLNPGDWREVPLWDDFTEAYEDALTRCATRDAPWYLVPADKKWFRNVAVMDRIVRALRPYRKLWLDTLKEMAKTRMKEIHELRSQAKKRR
jgi:polyphosphate kinase 2 (PPK2 family)